MSNEEPKAEEPEPVCICRHGLHSHTPDCDLCGSCPEFRAEEQKLTRRRR